MDNEDQSGSIEDIPEETSDVQDSDDGGAIVQVKKDENDVADTEDFYKNLAEDLPPTISEKLASDLLELISYDKKSREKRDEQYEEGLKRTGLGNEAPGG